MQASFSVIEEALKIKSSLEGSQTEEPTGTLQGKIVTHWTFYVFTAGSIVGLVTAVAAGILQMWPLCIIGGILCVTNIVGAWYASELGAVPAIQEGVEQLKIKIQDFAKKINELDLSIKNLKDIEKLAEQNTKNFETIIQNGKKDLQNSVDQFHKIQKELDEYRKELEKYKILVKTMGENTKKLSDQTLNLSNHVVKTEHLQGSLENETLTISKEGDKIDVQVKIFDKETDDYEEAVKNHVKQIDLMKNSILELAKERALLEKENIQLLERVKELGNIEKKAHETSLELEKTKSEMLKIPERMKSETEHLKDYKKFLKFMKSSFSEDWKKTPGYKEWEKTAN